ncbi:peptide chain release factor 3 [Pseudalkalibacillus salsuginis]|uniref:peptide chain release factor 3 n=1 Tax=Pseudalkalibacillus salsuginis TaxID=2910972 RepID=UPI001F21259E|nr:peptide chain release factor 3 [Pseudalkalibacillus salsuginis]MCF6409550.1 peptide chain release factor 3 [Pseudalkalibacillus salsuginis]
MRKSSQLEEEINKRKTFAIISHPDAGKTTLTEKILFLSGAIRSAGTVKSKKSDKYATSDWMEMEKQRGISITSSVMQFTYQDNKINILDTPGHQDFSEDTYRTLMAVDSVVMIIDAAKGVEAQTKKLFKVCSDRGIPIFTFINKMDRQGREPFELLEEIEEVLGIQSFPMNWPIGMGHSFQGVYDRVVEKVHLYNEQKEHQSYQLDKGNWNEDILKDLIEPEQLLELQETITLLNEAGDSMDLQAIKQGKQTPVFFGSAISSFGIPSFMEHFLELAPEPQGRDSNNGFIHPSNRDFSGFVFKIQANMNPAHRDRIAFMRVCSGKFIKGMEAWNDRTAKSVKLAQGQQFFAASRGNIDEAFPGDIVGLYDPGLYQIGDTLCGTKNTFSFGKLPHFPPEHFAKVRAKNAMKQKHFYKGVSQLAEEGAVQVYKTDKMEETILGVVGVLQFEVFEHRLKTEYGVDLDIQPLPHSCARWVSEDKNIKIDNQNYLVHDQVGNPVIIFENDFSLRWFKDKNPDIEIY